MMMDFAFRVKYALTKDARFDRGDGRLSIIVLIGHEYMFHIGGMVQHIHGGVTLQQEQFNDKPHRKFDHVTIGLTLYEKAKGVAAKVGETSPPTRDRWAGKGG